MTYSPERTSYSPGQNEADRAFELYPFAPAQAPIQKNSLPFEVADLPYEWVPGARYSRNGDTRVPLPVVERESVEGEIFDKMRLSPYAVVLAAHGKDVYHPEVYRAYRRLRYAEYAGRGWIDADSHDADYGEHDEHDDNALQIVVLKRLGKNAVAIGGDRVVLKASQDDELPVESKYRAIFGQQPAKVGATEISRHMFRSADPTERALSEIASIRAMVGLGLKEGYTHAYGMIEQYLGRLMRQKHLRHEMLSDYEKTPEYGNTENALLYVEPHAMLEDLGFKHIFDKNPSTRIDVPTWLMFRGTAENLGIGYHSKYFIANLGRFGMSTTPVHSGGIAEELKSIRDDASVTALTQPETANPFTMPVLIKGIAALTPTRLH